MQLYALDNTSLVLAGIAEKGKDYTCPECASKVRVRGGPARQTHFYHLSLPKQCRQHEKSQEHIQLQLKLLDLFGAHDAQIECPFPAIGRIADVAWHSKKIVFEIQCSPISLEEVQCRVHDYTRAGYEVVWILHDKQFNQKKLAAAESFLRGVPCYFTNIDKTGGGIVYDQFEVIKSGQRRFKGPPLTVKVDLFSRLPSFTPPDIVLPQTVSDRLKKWKCYVQGDLLERLLKEGNLFRGVQKMISIEKEILEENKAQPQRLPLPQLIAKCYRSLIDLLLKKLSRP
jgi:competence protein CoiA